MKVCNKCYHIWAGQAKCPVCNGIENDSAIVSLETAVLLHKRGGKIIHRSGLKKVEWRVMKRVWWQFWKPVYRLEEIPPPPPEHINCRCTITQTKH